MDRYERTLLLHRMLKSARYPVTLKRVQEELQCSRATMYRDVAFLRDALGAPIESDPENGTIHYARDEVDRFELPGLWLSSEELAALLALNELLDRSDPGVLAGALAPFRARIETLLTTTIANIETTVETVRAVVVRPLSSLSDLSAFWGGLRRGLETYKKSAPPRRTGPVSSSRRPEDSDEHLFIG